MKKKIAIVLLFLAALLVSFDAGASIASSHNTNVAAGCGKGKISCRSTYWYNLWR